MENSGLDSSHTELGAFLEAMWRRRWGVVAGTVAAMLIGLVAFFVVPEQYEAKARLVVAEYHMREALTGDDGRETFEALVSSRNTYAALVNSPTIARSIVEEHDLGAELDLTVDELLESVDVQLISNTAVLELTVELPDAEIAREVALSFAEKGAALSREINDADRGRAEDVLAARLQVAEAELDRLEKQIAELQSTTGEPSPRLQRLQAEFETAIASRGDIAQRLNSSEITVVSQIGELVVVDEPLVPEEPSSPGALMMLLGAGFLGFVLALLVAGLAAGMESTSRRHA